MAPTPQEYSSTQQEEILTTPASDGERIVISGMSGLYPASESVKDLSEILYNKVNPITEAAIRFKYNHPEVSKHAGSVPGLNHFDAQFFKVHYRLSLSIDPMARKILEQSYQAIYDAGINPETLSGKKVGVYIGSCFSETEKACFYEAASRFGFGILGCSKTMFANRVSYWLNAKGPSMALDEACCSSTAALEQAYLDLSRGTCEAAIVGGAYLCLHPQSSVHYGRIMKLSCDGKTKSFDENADGCAKSEAINVLFLQKAKDALRIYADVLHVKSEFTCVLTGKAGPKYGFDREVDKTINFMKSFYEEASIPAQAIEYVEAFGCAVPDADRVELQAIEQVFCDKRDDPLLVGSVMSNIGYNEASSGISAITKVLLGYHHGQLAANLHCSSPRQDVAALREGRMRIVTEHERFRRTYVAVNGMSVTGVNSHVLLHGHYKPKDVNRYISSIPYLVTISARQDSSVTHVFDNLKSNPIDPEQLRLLHNIHQESIPGHLGRGFIILKTNEDQETVSLCEKAAFFDDARRPLWFVYSGMGSQWAGMGTQLMRIPIFAAAIERCRQVLEPRGLDIVDIITSADEKTFDNILHSFVGIAAIQIGLTDVLRELGLVPDGIIGHSVGELGCAYADGCLTAEEMILSAYSRGLVSLQTPFIRGSMAAIGLGYEQISKLCPPEIGVACHNGPESSTISGPADVMREFVAELTAKGIFAKEVPCSNIAYHSRYIADAGPHLLKYLTEVIKSPKPRSERWLSTSVPQDRWNDPIAQLCSAEYHTNNLLSPVLFEETSRLVPSNAVLVEVAPHGLLQAILKRSLPSDCKNIALTRRKHPDNALLLLEGIGTLFMEGYNPKLHVLYPKVELPVSTGTPFLSHLVKWAHNESWPLTVYSSANRKTAPTCDFKICVHDSENSYLQGHSIRGHTLYPFAASLVLAWDTLAMVMGVPKKQLSVDFRDLHLYSQPILHDQRLLTLSVALHRGTGRFEILNEGSKVATGYIMVMNKETQKHLSCNYVKDEITLKGDLNAEDIYHLLRDKDYSYSGEFRSISCANQLLNEAELLWSNNWVTLIDGLLQLNALRQPLTSFSLPTHIRRMCIDTHEHEQTIQNTTMVDDELLIKAKVLENFDMTRCGGVSINNIKWENLPPLNDKTMALKTLRFVPYFKSNLDVSSSLEVYFQIIAENVNKTNLNVVGIVNQPVKGSVFVQLNDTVTNMFGVNVSYKQLKRESVVTNPNNFLATADLVLVQNLSTDDKLCELLYGILSRDQFVVSEEELALGAHSRPASLYRVLSSHTIVDNGSSQQTELQLVRWGPSATSATTAVTVRTHTDIALLTSTRNSLSPQHSLLVLAPYPPPRGLKELVNDWRREANRNKIYLIMVAKDSNDNFAIDEVPDIDLAFNVFENGTWGGEYYMSVKNTESVSNNITLESKQIGDYNSLTWVEASDIVGPGVTVMVHYAGISNHDTKRADGSILFKNNVIKYGMDFSGIRDSGERVMGLVESGAASSVVRARPELLWPVPAHWSLEDAATVPLAYAHAFYCLFIKKNLQHTRSVLVHGGAGALGQATIALALAHGYEVYTTVSDLRKKHFLLKLFPGLKAANVGSSRDRSFEDMVLNNSKGKGVDVVINLLRGDLKESSIHCVGFQGICLDVSQLCNQDEGFTYGMSYLTKQRAYAPVDFSTIFDNADEIMVLHRMMSEGISRGYVRPLSRVTYAPHDAARAFRLLSVSGHRGRVLLRMRESLKQIESRLTCNADRSHLILGNNEVFGLQLADRLVERGAKKLCIHYTGQSMNYLQMKIRLWKKNGVEVVVVSADLREEKDIIALLNNAMSLGPMEGIYVTVDENQQDIQEDLLSTLDSVSRKLCPDLKYFAVVNNVDNMIGKELCLCRLHSQLPATTVTLPKLSLESRSEVAWCRAAVDLTEKALRGKHAVVLAHITPMVKYTLLQKITKLADITIPDNISNNTTLKELGLKSDKIPPIRNFLRLHHNVVFEDNEISLLTVEKLQQLENTIIESDFKDIKSLSTFFTYVDSDELLATTDVVFLPTLVNSGKMRNDEFDASETYLCIVPGMEGHHERFRMLCERLKLPAFVLQPGLDRPHETVQETAERFAEAFLKKTGLKTNFYLLGYETGVSIALEMAAILEDHGLTGTVYCIGHAPEEFNILLEQLLSEFGTDEQLQNAITRHMFELMTGGDTTVTIENSLRTANTWSQKVGACLRALQGRVPHSSQYSRAIIETALARIERARSHVPRAHPLRSQLVLLRAATTHATSAPLELQRHSQQPVAVHQLHAPLAHAARDLRCAAIVNAYLKPEIRDNFEKKNICDTYLVNPSTYMKLDREMK